MEDYSWEELTELYNECLTLPASEQATFLLENTASKPALRKRLMEMLAQSNEAEGYFNELKRDIAEGLETEIPDLAKPGEVINNYKIIEKIGIGGSSQVFVADRVDGQFDKRVAVKIFKKKDATSFSDKTENEKQFLASLNHPSIAQIFDGGTLDNGHPFIIMEFVEGDNLRTFLEQKKPNEKDCLNMYSEICAAVREAHNNLILHLDIKPGNLIVKEDQRIKLLDFGIAQRLKQNASIATVNKLTFNFAAPEQLTGRPLSVQTDIYQLGLLLYFLLSKGNILEGQKQVQSLLESVDSTVIKSKELLAIVKKCLQQESENRYQSVDQILADIKNFQKKYPISTYSSSWHYRAQKYVQRNSVATLLLSLVFLSLIGGTIISLRQAKIAEAEKEKAENTSAFIKDLFTSSNPLLAAEDYSSLTVFEFFDTKKKAIVGNNTISDDEKWQLLSILYEVYRGLSEIDKALEITVELEKILSNKNNELLFTILNARKGFAYSLNYNFNKADSFLTIAYNNLEILMENDPLEASLLLNQIGLNLHLQGKYDSAQIFYNHSIKLLKDTDNQNQPPLIEAYVYFSQLKRSIGQFDSAFYFSSIVIDSKINEFGKNSPQLINSYADRALINMETGAYKNAEKDFNKAFEIGFQRVDSSNTSMLIIFGNYIIFQELQENYKKAIDLSEQYITLSIEKFGYDNLNVAYAKLQLANSLMGDGQLSKSKVAYNDGLQILAKIQDRDILMEGIFLMQKSYLAIQEESFEEALQLAKESKAIMGNMLPPNHYRLAVINARTGRALIGLGTKEEGTKLINDAVVILKKSGAKTQKYLEEAQGYLNEL